ncbi:MAG: GGDEF domain-containing protein [Oscillospiraceae bacterium]|nr:GGDEF domain-containing protein [Oscillospiraceae bacterium]
MQNTEMARGVEITRDAVGVAPNAGTTRGFIGAALNTGTAYRSGFRWRLHKKNGIAIRFLNINLLLFALAICIMATVMAVAYSAVIGNLSSEYAARYGAGAADTLSARVDKEIILISKTARSSEVIAWMLDEDDAEKKSLAFTELEDVVGELYSFNIYIGLNKSLLEYRIEVDNPVGDFSYVAALSRDKPEDEWYFDCIESDSDYQVLVGIDNVLNKKRVFINHKVELDGAALGVISTGLEFSHIAGELFSQYDDYNLRGLVIDGGGAIHMDSDLLDDRDFLHHEFESTIEDAFAGAAPLSAIRTYLDGAAGGNAGGATGGNAGGNTGGNAGSDIGVGAGVGGGQLAPVRLRTGPYKYMAIAPVLDTDWYVVILSGTPSLFDLSLFIPVMLTMLVLLIAFALAASAANYRLILLPLGKLDHSLALLKENSEMQIYGADRDDELGNLSNTIQDLFNKANIDTLTGIYNRRFMENNLVHIMEILSRANGMLSTLMIDIDFFKRFNDTYGHDQGDICLREVAGTLASGVTRANDFTARYGGEEFVVVLPNTDEAGARVVAEKLLNNVRGLDIPHSGGIDGTPYVTVSIGVTTGRVSFMHCWEDYIRQADKALYASKQNGRNQYTYMALTK